MEITGALALAAIAVIPAIIWYYLWLGRHLAPLLAPLPIILAMTLFALAAAFPWLIVAAVVWASHR